MGISNNIKEIKSENWQPAVENYEAVLEDIEEIRQSISIILNTPKGSVPHRPEFGSDIYKYIDLPMNEAKMGVIQEIILALTIWEPRVKVVNIETEIKESHLCFIVNYEINLTKQADLIEVHT